MATSQITKKYKLWRNILTIISVLLNVAPLGIYIIKAVLAADLLHEKVGLSMTVLIVMILTIVSWVNKVTLRSSLWILLIGLYLCLDFIMTPLIIIAICQILDELIVTPLRNHCKINSTVNSAIDKRMNA